jgi:imidazolonepropionase-like amidohydrolase
VTGDVLTRHVPPRAEVLPGRFSTAGLVDAHVHVALGESEPMGLEDALDHLRSAARSGALVVREMGDPGRFTLSLPDDPTLPQVITCGMQLAVEPYFAGMVPVPPGSLVQAGLAEIERGATWVKVLADWITPGLLYPPDELAALVRAAHEAGARVAAHCLWEDVFEVVESGVDSVEHGARMDERTLTAMATRGTAWVPTANAWEVDVAHYEALLEDPALDPDRRARIVPFLAWQRENRDVTARMIPRARELGVTVLASTDRKLTVADEVIRFVSYGLGPADAFATATSAARRFLGLDGPRPGGPADVVTYAEDPREEPEVLKEPVAILRRGVRIL